MPDGRPIPARYAAMARADRELKLSGYEVFRFGATELLDPDPPAACSSRSSLTCSPVYCNSSQGLSLG